MRRAAPPTSPRASSATSCRRSPARPFVVLNKPGAFGLLAIDEMAKSAPDGYTLMLGNVSTNAITPIIYKSKLTFDYAQSVVAVTNLVDVPAFLLVTTANDFPVKTVPELVDYAKKNPGKVKLRHRRHRLLSALRHGLFRQARRRSRHVRPAEQERRLRRHPGHVARRRAGRIPQRRQRRRHGASPANSARSPWSITRAWRNTPTSRP